MSVYNYAVNSVHIIDHFSSFIIRYCPAKLCITHANYLCKLIIKPLCCYLSKSCVTGAFSKSNRTVSLSADHTAYSLPQNSIRGSKCNLYLLLLILRCKVSCMFTNFF